MTNLAHPRYTGSALPGNAELVVLFSSVVAFPGKDFHTYTDLKRLVIDIEHDQTGTANFYKSQNRGVSWIQVDTEAVAVPGATATSILDYAIEPYMDFKVEWLNGVTPQTVFAVDMALTDERSPLV